MELFASLLIAAREDPQLREQVLHLSGFPRLQRQSLVNTALHEMALRGEAADARAAFAILATDEGARAAAKFLRDADEA
jgi:hypothetical protein